MGNLATSVLYRCIKNQPLKQPILNINILELNAFTCNKWNHTYNLYIK